MGNAKVNYRDDKLFAFLGIASERLLRKFNGLGLANTTWAFATVHCRDEKLFAVLAIAAERMGMGIANAELSPQQVGS